MGSVLRIRAYASDAEFAPAYDVQPWRDEAACRGAGLAAFFPERGSTLGIGSDMYAEARALCDGCPVLDECREDALSSSYAREGFRAGMTPAQRRKVRSARPEYLFDLFCDHCKQPFRARRALTRFCSHNCIKVAARIRRKRDA